MCPERDGDGLTAVVDRAVAFIDANVADGITVCDVADGAYVSVRTLNRAFHRHLGVTPAAYLRSRRLAGARHDLEAAGPVGTTVTAVATRWGFSDPGRFAAVYRHEYGETPRATLRA